MNQTFETMASMILAWNQVAMFCGALVLLLLGGVIVADFIYWRVRAQHFTGIISGVRQGQSSRQGPIYYPVISYRALDGDMILADTNGGSSTLTNKIPGRKVSIMVLPRDAETVRIKSCFWGMIGLFIVATGIGLFSIAVDFSDINGMTVMFVGVVLLWGFFKIKASIKPKKQREKKAEFKARKQAERQAKRQAMPLLNQQDVLQIISEHDQTNKKILPWMLGIGIIVFGGGIYLAKDLVQLMSISERTEGYVVSIQSQHRANSEASSYTYYPVVEYQNLQGNTIRFQDKVGSSPATDKKGDRVQVLYDPFNEGRAQIDRGLWNWLVSGSCLFLGVLIIGTTLNGFRRLSRRATNNLDRYP